MPIRTAFKSQYHSALTMLRQTITQCPDELWLDPTPVNRYWHIAYHTLFFTHLYLHRRHEDFVPWNKGREHFEHFGQVPYPPHHSPQREPPYTKIELLEFADFIETQLDERLHAMDLDADDCGFRWYHMPKLEHQIMNIRHLQHHAGQLADRLRRHADIATDWRG
ncbi:MAG: hypothetical protein ACYC26_14520 [Phycisphaerales bacterium]